MSRQPGYVEGLNAIAKWLEEIYPADIFGGAGDFDPEYPVKGDPGTVTIKALRYALSLSMRDRTVKPAIFISAGEDE